MAGFPVLVEGLLVNLDSVKNKLAIYFQSKRKSGGGECEIKALPDQTKFLVWFESEKVQKNVAKKEFHLVQLLNPEPEQLRVTIYEEDNGRESSVNSIGLTPGANSEPAVEQSQLLTSSDKISKPEQSLPKEVQTQEFQLLHQESVSESSSNQLLVSSNSPVDTDVVAMLFERISPDVEVSVNSECSWILTCLSHSGLKKIISQEQYTIAGKTLNVQLYDKHKEDEKYESQKFILKGFDGSSRLEHISLYIDSLSNNARQSIEPLKDGTTVVVTFITDIDGNSFVRNCCQKPFENNSITAYRLKKTNSVQIEGLHPNTNEELLELYFSNTSRSGGGEIAEICINAFERTAILHFHDPEVVRRVTEREHSLKDFRLTVSRYCHDLQLPLYGPTGLKVKLPEQCNICINPSLLNYIQANMHHYNHELEQISKDVYCNITFADSPNSKHINLKPTLDANILLWYKIANDWKKHATEEVQKFMGRFDFKDFPIDQDLWEKVKCKSKQLKSPGLDILHLPIEKKLVVVGKVSNVSDASRELQDILEKAKEELENERNTVEEEIPFECFEELEFLETNVKDAVSFVKISTHNAPPVLKLKGLKKKVGQAHKVISHFRSQLERKPLNQSSHMKDFIKSLDLMKFVQTHFVQNELKATLMIKESVELLAFKADVQKVEDKIKGLFQEEAVEITPDQIQVTQDDKWTRFLEDLKTQHKSTCRIIEEKNPASVITVGFSNNVSNVANLLKSYLNKKQIITKFISAEVVKVDYMEKFLILEELPEVQNKEVTISFIRIPNPGFNVLGRAEQIDEAVSAIEDSLSQFCQQTFTYCNPGETTSLIKHSGILQDKVKKHRCMLFIKTKEEIQSGTNLLKHVSKQSEEEPVLPIFLPEGPILQVGGVTVELKKGDITQEITDVMVNCANNTLDLDTGVSHAILKAAGSSVRKECMAKGHQPSGSIVVTSAGHLPCQYIVHMVGVKSAVDITASVSKVLEECDRLNITAAAFPAVGTGRGAISGETVINAFFSGLENYFLNVTSSNMKIISIIAFEDHIYDCFADFFNKKKWNSGAGKMDTAPITLKSLLGFALPVQQKELLPTQLQIQNVIVEVKKGDITQEDVEAIVNSTNTTLNLNSGVSKVILAEGGQTVMDECKLWGPQPKNGVVVTSGGQLACKYIVHMVGQTDPALITASVEKVLEECEKKNISTVSFPALGTGVGKVKPELSALSMLIGFENHLKQNQSSTITSIYMVALEDSVHKVFTDVLQQNSQQKTKTISINIGKVKVLAALGDIIKERTDAIVNSTDVHLDLKTGVSQAILTAGGQPLLDECKQLGVQSLDSVVTTRAGNLHVKYILHLIDWTNTKNINASIGKVLKECERLQISSVAFPAIGTGAGKLNPFRVANALLDAISEYVINFVPPALSMIRIILFTPLMTNLFHQCMKQRFQICQNDVPTTPPLNPGYQIEQAKPVDWVYPIVLSTKKHLTSTVDVYGMTNNNIDMVRKDVENLIKEHCKSKTIVNKGSSWLSLNQMQEVTDLCENLQLRVEIQKNDIIINGYTDEVLEFIVKFNSVVQSATEQMCRKQEECQIKKFVQWEFMNNGKFQPYDQSLNCDLEKAYQDKKETFKFKKNGETYLINFKKKEVQDSKGNMVAISRRLLEGGTFELPATWSDMVNQEFVMEDLTKNTVEYNEVVERFKKSCRNQRVTVIKVERIQNRKLWQSYSVRKQTAERKMAGTNVEQILYHGTIKEIIQKVNKTGFNRSFCGRNATSYGKGTYFALNADYSCDDRYSSPDDDECKYIYQAQVITGKMCVGKPKMLEPAPVNAQGDPTDLCDCAVNDLNNPSIFVIFCDDGAYPEYLITFKTALSANP